MRARHRTGKHITDASRPWFAGVDWASSKHDVTPTDDSGKVVALEPADPQIVELREWLRMADESGRDLRRYMSRLREQLQRYLLTGIGSLPRHRSPERP
jgi:hypothetical protein